MTLKVILHLLTVVADGFIVDLDIGDASSVSDVEGALHQIGDIRHLPGQVDLVVGDDAAFLHVQNLRGGVPGTQRPPENSVQLGRRVGLTGLRQILIDNF